MAGKKNEVAETKSAEVVQFDPTMFEADAGMGLENMGAEDLALPFLKILGGMSKELDVLEDARKGDIYNTVTGAVLKGKDGVKVVPCAYQRRFIRWALWAKGRALLWPSTHRVRPCQKPNGLPRTIRTMSKTVPVTTSKRRTSTMCSCCTRTVR